MRDLEDPAGTPPPGSADPAGEPVTVPPDELSEDLLRRVIESFVLREGTDYGEQEVCLESKVAAVVRQLQRGEALIIFDPGSESIDIVTVAPGKRRSSRR